MKQVDFSSDRVASNLVRVALPMLVAQVINLLYNIVDRIYIARIPGTGTSAIGAVGLCFSLIVFITAFANLFGSGGAPLYAIELGKGNKEEAHRLLNVSFTMLLLLGIVLTAAGELFAAPLLRLIGGSTDDMLGHALPYLRIYLLGTVFQMLALGMNPFINAQGFPGIGMRTILVGAVTNTLLDPVFIFVLGMGVRGAAAATVIAQLLSCLSALHFLLGGKAPQRPALIPLPKLRAQSARIGRIVSLGVSSFIMQATNGLVQISANRVLALTGGDIYISVFAIVSSVRQLLDMPVLAFSDGASPMLSYSYGAGRADHIRRIIRIFTTIALSYTGVVWLLISLFPRFFIGIFSSDPALPPYAVPALHIYFFAFIFQALQYCGQTVFKSLGKRNQTVFFSLFRKIVIVVPLTWLLPLAFGFGTNGVFMAEPISNVIGGSACFGTMLATVLPELKRLEEKKKAV